jgi:hypothetical protein
MLLDVATKLLGKRSFPRHAVAIRDYQVCRQSGSLDHMPQRECQSLNRDSKGELRLDHRPRAIHTSSVFQSG